MQKVANLTDPNYTQISGFLEKRNNFKSMNTFIKKNRIEKSSNPL